MNIMNALSSLPFIFSLIYLNSSFTFVVVPCVFCRICFTFVSFNFNFISVMVLLCLMTPFLSSASLHLISFCLDVARF